MPFKKLCAVAFLSLLFSSLLFPQSKGIAIRDTVAIAPGKILADTLRRGKDINRYRTAGLEIVSRFTAQIFAGETVAITILNGSTGADNDLVLRSPYEATLFTHVQDRIGESWTSEVFTEDATLEVGILTKDCCNSYPEYGAIVDATCNGQYEVSFADVLQDDYNDVVVSVKIGNRLSTPNVKIFSPVGSDLVIVSETEQPVIEFSEWHCPGSGDPNEAAVEWNPGKRIITAEYYEQLLAADGVLEVPVTVRAHNQLGEMSRISTLQLRAMVFHHFTFWQSTSEADVGDEIMLEATARTPTEELIGIPLNTPLILSASPAEYGYLMNYSNETTSSGELECDYFAAYWGALSYVAEGTVPERDVEVTITVRKKDDARKKGSARLVLKAPSCPGIRLSSGQIGGGDTVAITIFRRLANGEVMEYPADTKFLYSMISGSEFGRLIGSDDEGIDIVSTSPVLFVANETIDAESAAVIITARLDDAVDVRMGGNPDAGGNGQSAAPVMGRRGKESTLMKSVKSKEGTAGTTNECLEATATIVITKEEQLCPAVTLSPSSLTPGDTAEVIVKGKKEDGTIEDYPAGQLFNVRITEGDSYGELLEVNAGRKSDTLNGAKLPIRFIAANTIDADSVVFTIRAVPVEATQTTTTTVNKKGEKVTSARMVYREMVYGSCNLRDVMGTIVALDHFKVWLEQDTVAFTESAKLFVQAKNKDSNDIFLSDNATIQLHVGSGSEYGTFIKPDNDTIWNSIPLFTLPYGEVKAGKVKFAAVKKNPSLIELVSVNADLIGTVRKSGTKQVPVVEQTLRIVMEGEREVVPRNLRGLQNPPNPTEENKKRFTVQLTRNKAGVANHPFRVTTNYVDGMGGHDHITPRRQENNSAQTRINYGYFILRRINNNTEHDRPYNSQTQEDGRENFDYVSSEFGDSMRIIVKSIDQIKQKFFKDSITIAEKVSELVRLDDDANYDLVGGTPQHHGPPTYTDNHNHFSTADVRTNIQNIAAEYHQQFRNEDVLQINDMSLPFGGGFDVNGNWERDIVPGGAHQTHRQGLDADIRTALPGIRSGVNIRDENGEVIRDRRGRIVGNRDFVVICQTYHATANIHGTIGTRSEHYHLDF